MNLLTFKERYQIAVKKPAVELHELRGYMNALHDVTSYIEQVTEHYAPGRRHIDAVELLNSITDTNTTLMIRLAEIEKLVKTAMQKDGEQILRQATDNDPDDIKNIF